MLSFVQKTETKLALAITVIFTQYRTRHRGCWLKIGNAVSFRVFSFFHRSKLTWRIDKTVKYSNLLSLSNTMAARPDANQQLITHWLKYGTTKKRTRPLDKDNDFLPIAMKKQTREPIGVQDEQPPKTEPKRSVEIRKATCGKSRAAIRQHWVEAGKCFGCQKAKNKLIACQCFQTNGVQGFGTMLCRACDEGFESDSEDKPYFFDHVLTSCLHCDARLCDRSCEYSKCLCGDTHCDICVEHLQEEIETCGKCGQIKCPDCDEEDDGSPFLKICRFCKKRGGCTSCAYSVERCSFCPLECCATVVWIQEVVSPMGECVQSVLTTQPKTLVARMLQFANMARTMKIMPGSYHDQNMNVGMWSSSCACDK